MTNINELFTFIDKAEKSRKYLSANAQNLRKALRIVQSSLTQEEANSVELFSKNLNQIYNEYYSKNGTGMSVASLETYKSRARKAIKDFEKYGTDPAKLAAWQPTQRSPRKEKKVDAEIVDVPADAVQDKQSITQSPQEDYTNMDRVILNFSDGRKAIISTPAEITKDDAEIIIKYGEFLKIKAK